MSKDFNKKINPKKIPYAFEMHGEKIIDNYAWLRDKNWPDEVSDKRIIDYLQEENKNFEDFITPLNREKEEIFQELKGRIELTDQSPYNKKDNFYYYTRTESDKDYPIYCRKNGSVDAEEEIILDINEIAKDQKYTSIASASVSPDHKLIAYSVDFTGEERYTIQVKNLSNHKMLEDTISDTIGEIVWHEEMNGFFYLPTDEKWRHNKVKFHALGTDKNKDKTILHEADDLYSVSAYKSSSKKYIFINVSGHDNNEIYYIDMNDHSFIPKLFDKRKPQIIYSIDHGGNYFYKNNNDGAKNFHIFRSISKNYSVNTKWAEYIGEKSNHYLSDFNLTKDYLILNYQVQGLSKIVVKQLYDGKENELSFPEPAYLASCYPTNFVENDIRIDYSSLARPSTVYGYDFLTNTLEVIKTQKIPSGFKPEEYNVERIFATSPDGAKVPISLFYKKNLLKKDGSNPLYLYGYGSYGIAISPTFKNSAISLVDRGFVYAIAHIRGGDDLGYEWYKAAKFLQKKITFTDFISVAEKLIEDKYTNKGKITIMGGSAGGMLIGNVINERPELFKAAIAHVPFVDVLNTMLDDTLPLTPGEYKEWGNPKEKEYFDYIRSYSPYENVSSKNYPHLFVTAGLSDPRVGYWEAAKWVAKIREKRSNNNLLLYKTNMNFGHSGASGRFDYLKEIAEDLVFIFYLQQKTK